jgi:two-component system, LytTR family, sensor histidine kinase AlgZ
MRRLAAYLAAALPLGAAVAGLLSRGPQGLPTVPALWMGGVLALAALALLLPVWFVCRVLPFDRTARSRLLGTHAVGALVAGTLWSYIGSGLARILDADGGDPLPPLYRAHVPTILAGGALLYLVAAAFHYMLLAVDAAQRAEKQALEHAMLAREAELRALKAQVHPHFLFNSLNSISSLTASDPARAREMCILLAEFFRKSLAIGEKASVSLAEELEVARTYLAIERLRLGERLTLEEAVDDAGRSCAVPPLLLQPLVENAIRHGIATCVDGGVLRVEARTNGTRLRVLVENPFDPDAPARPGVGLGLSNVRRRLQARYGDTARMEAHRAPATFRVTLEIPVEAVA